MIAMPTPKERLQPLLGEKAPICSLFVSIKIKIYISIQSPFEA
jgi:hypothetical protein